MNSHLLSSSVFGFVVILFFFRIIYFQLILQMQYEEAFWKHNQNIIRKLQNQENIDEYIPLTFTPPKDAATLSKLCKKHLSTWSPSRWNLREYKPSIQVLLMRFRRLAIARKPFRVEAIRCSDKNALIEAGDGSSGYMLIVDETNKDSNVIIFKIYSRFQFKREIFQTLQMGEDEKPKTD